MKDKVAAFAKSRALWQAGDAGVEVVDGAGDGCACRPDVLAVFVPRLVHGDGLVAVLPAGEVAQVVGVGDVLRHDVHGVALG